MINEAIRSAGREMRRRFDSGSDKRRGLRPGEVAAIKRLATVGDAAVDGVFWSLAKPYLPTIAGSDDPRAIERAASAAAIVVCAFGATGATSEPLAFGRWLHDGLAAKKVTAKGAAMRFRRLVAARTGDELAHHLRSLCKLVAQPLDWGTLLDDVVQWSRGDAARDAVLRRWAQDFYGARDEGEDESGDSQ
jgi:CRISPR type I-E-associated protein CasB/Cse2